jgi:hypothetical protein
MRGEATDPDHGAKVVEEPIESLDQSPARDGEARSRHPVGEIAVAEC